MRRYLLIDHDGRATMADAITPPSDDSPLLAVDVRRSAERFARLSRGREWFTHGDLALVAGGTRERVADWSRDGIVVESRPPRGNAPALYDATEAIVAGVCGGLFRARQTRPTLRAAANAIRAELRRETARQEAAAMN